MRRTPHIVAFSIISVGVAIACSPAASTIGGDGQNVEETQDGGSAKKDSGTVKDSGKSTSSSSSGHTSSSGGSSSGGKRTDGGYSSSSGGSSGGSSGTSGSSGGGDDQCGSTTSGQDCYQCCADAHPKGSQVMDEAYFGCICDQACQSECSTSCANQTPPKQGDACDTCSQGADECMQAEEQACQADSDCKAFMACTQNAGCQSKN
jgi:hypothetical protein